MLTDILPPSLKITSPGLGVNGGAMNVPWIWVFSEPIVVGTGNFQVRDSAGNLVSTISVNDTSKVTVGSTQIAINQITGLKFGTGYTVSADSGVVRDSAGNPWAGGSNILAFTYGSAGGSLQGGLGNDTLIGGAGNDTLDGGAGNNLLTGGLGNDTFVFGPGHFKADNFDPNNYTYTYKDATGIKNDFDVITDFNTRATEQDVFTVLSGGRVEIVLAKSWIAASGNSNAGWVSLVSNGYAVDLRAVKSPDTGSSGVYQIKSIGAATTLIGSKYSDVLISGTGLDTLQGGVGDDTYVVNALGDVVLEAAGQGTDTIRTSLTYSLLTLINVENLTLTGNAAVNATGNSLGNTLTGNDAANTLNGGVGADTLIGGRGDDVFWVDNIGDVVIDSSVLVRDTVTGLWVEVGGIDTVNSSISYTLAQSLDSLNLVGTKALTDKTITGTSHIENLTLTGTQAINGTGNAANNVIIGNVANNILIGAGGRDTITGGAGADTFLAAMNSGTVQVTDLGNGVDILNVALRATVNATLYGAWTATYATVNAGTVNLYTAGYAVDLRGVTGGTNGFTVTNSGGTTTLTGSKFSDTLAGGTGQDTLVGGMGDDVYIFNNPDKETEVVETSNAGRDTILGGLKSYTLTANVENYVNDLSWSINGAQQAVTITGNMSDNLIKSAPQSWDSITTILGTVKADKLSNEYFFGMGGNDTLMGGGGSDSLDGGVGADMLIGGTGDDSYWVDSFADRVVELANEGVDTVFSDVSFSLTNTPNLENLFLTGYSSLSAVGNSLANILKGNSGNNVLDGGAGNDTIVGASVAKGECFAVSGNDVLRGGDGVDWADYSAAVNRQDLVAVTASLATGSAETWCYKTVAKQIIKTIAGKPQLVTTYETKWMRQTDQLDGIENLRASAFNDSLTGDSGKNVLDGAAGNDTLDGGAGDDTLLGGTGDDSLLGGTGIDCADYAAATAAVVVSLIDGIATGGAGNDTLQGMECVMGSRFGDSLTGDDGNNTLDGAVGADTLAGGLGDDTYRVDNLNDVLTEASGAGTDLVQSSVTYTLGGNLENLTLTGNTATEATGNDLANVLTGNSANNILDGGLGADTMAGGLGNDSYVVDDAGDFVSEKSLEGTDVVKSAIAYTLGANLENLTLTGSTAINGTGNTLANVITGNAGDNILSGGAGNDTLNGGLGDDSLFGGAGNDTLTGGDGRDQFVFSTSLSSRTNIDTVLDFQTGTDQLVLSEAVFAQLADLGIGASPLAENLVIGTAALDANDYLVYNSSTGVLSYDADGSGTASAAVAFAKIELNGVPPTDLSATDFIVAA